MKAEVLGIHGLSFVDDISWWADGENDEEVSAKLSEAATAVAEWATRSGIVFDWGKLKKCCFTRRGPLHQPTAGRS